MNELFEAIYKECKQIIKGSKDTNLKNKEIRLDKDYKLIHTDSFDSSSMLRGTAFELLFYNSMRELGFRIEATEDINRPDFLINETCNIECVISTIGQDESIIDISDESHLSSATLDDSRWGASRLTNSINCKTSKFKKYINESRLPTNLPCIIAIDASILSTRTFALMVEMNTKRILYGIGEQKFNVEVNGKVNISNDHQYRDVVLKKHGIIINTAYFADNKEFKHVSGILLYYSNQLFDYSNPILFINPWANVPIISEQFVGKMRCYSLTAIIEADTFAFDFI